MTESSKPRGGVSAPHWAALMRGLFEALNDQLAAFPAAAGAPEEGADWAGQARALSALVLSATRLKSLQAACQTETNAQQTGPSDADAELWRAEIQRRLDRIREQERRAAAVDEPGSQ